MFDVDKLNMLSYQSVKGKPVGMEKGVLLEGFDKTEDFKKKPNSYKEAYYKNVVIYTFKKVISDFAQDGKITHVGQHMLTPISMDVLQDYITANNLGTSEQNVLLPMSKFHFHELVSVGRLSTGTFANSAKLRAFLNGTTLNPNKKLSITLDGLNFDYSEIKIANDDSDNLLLIDAFINAAIDNLKALMLAKLGIKNSNSSLVSTLLVLGENDIAKIHKFIKYFQLDKYSLDDAIDIKTLTVEEKQFLKNIKGVTEELGLVRKGLSIIKEYDSSEEDLDITMDSLKAFNSGEEGFSFLQVDVPGVKYNSIVKNNPQLKPLIELHYDVQKIIKENFSTMSDNFRYVASELLRKRIDKIDDDDLKDLYNFLTNYLVASQISAGKDINEEMSQQALTYKLFRDANLKLMSTDLLDKIVPSVTRSNGLNNLKYYIGRVSDSKKLYYETVFQAFPQEVKAALIKYLFLNNDFAFNERSFASIIPAEDLRSLPITKDGKTALTLLQESTLTDESKISPYHDHLRLLLAASTFTNNSPLFLSRNNNVINGVVSPGHYSPSIPLTENTLVGTVHYNLKLVPKSDTLTTQEIENLLVNKENPLEYTTADSDQLFPNILKYRGDAYVKVARVSGTEHYYQIVGSSTALTVPVENYDVDQYFNKDLRVLRIPYLRVAKDLVMDKDYGPSLLVSDPKNLDRTQMQTYKFIGKNEDKKFVYENTKKSIIEDLVQNMIINKEFVPGQEAEKALLEQYKQDLIGYQNRLETFDDTVPGRVYDYAKAVIRREKFSKASVEKETGYKVGKDLKKRYYSNEGRTLQQAVEDILSDLEDDRVDGSEIMGLLVDIHNYGLEEFKDSYVQKPKAPTLASAKDRDELLQAIAADEEYTIPEEFTPSVDDMDEYNSLRYSIPVQAVTTIVEQAAYPKKSFEEQVASNIEQQYRGIDSNLKHRGKTFADKDALVKAILRKRDVNKVAGTYSDALLKESVLREPTLAKDILELPLADGSFLTKNEKASIIYKTKWLNQPENKQRIKNRINLNDGDSLVYIDENGNFTDVYNERRLTNDSLQTTGEYDILIRHADGTYSLYDIKNINVEYDDTYEHEYNVVKYGKTPHEFTFTNNQRDKAYLQLGIYALLIKEAGRKQGINVQFRTIEILPINSVSTLNTRQSKTKIPVSATFHWLDQYYKNELGIDLKEVNPQLVDPTAFITPVVETFEEQGGMEDVLINLRKAMVSASAVNAAGTNADSRAGLKAARAAYEKFMTNNVVTNTSEGIDAMSMYIGSLRSFGEKNIAFFSSEFDKATNKITEEKENTFREMQKYLKNYLVSEGISTTALWNRGNMEVYKKLMEKAPDGRWKLISVDAASSVAAKELITYLNQYYKKVFEYYSTDNAYFNGTSFVSSIQFQEDNIQYYEGWMPKVPKGSSEVFFENGVGQGLWKHYYNKYLTFAFEQDHERINKFAEMALPIKYANEEANKEDYMSFNIERQFDLFSSWYIHKKNMEHVHALGKAMAAETLASKDPRLKNVGTLIEKQLQQLVQNVTQENLVLSNRSTGVQSLKKLAFLLNNFASTMLLSFNLLGGAKNGIQILSIYYKNRLRQALDKLFGFKDGSRFHSNANFNVGIAKAVGALKNDMMRKDDKLMAMFRQFGFSSKYSSLRVNQHRYLTSGYINGIKQLSTILYSMPEELTAMASLYTGMNAIKHDGKSLYDLYELRAGKLVYTGTPRGEYNNEQGQLEGLSQEELSKMKYVVELTNGAYRKEERAILDYWIAGKLFTTFKRTLLGALRHNFRSAHLNPSMGNFETINGKLVWKPVAMEGRFNTLFGMLAAMVNKKGYEGYKLKNLSDFQKSNLVDLLIGTLVFLGVGMLAGDKKEEWEKWVGGMQSEFGNSYIPMGLANVDPVSISYSSKFAGNGLTFFSNWVSGELLGNEKVYTEDGLLKGGSQFYNMIPGLRNVTKRDLNDTDTEYLQDRIDYMPDNLD